MGLYTNIYSFQMWKRIKKMLVDKKEGKQSVDNCVPQVTTKC